MKKKAKVQRQLAYKYKDKEHYKHVVIISESMLNELGWPIGTEVEQRVDGDTLVMVPINPSEAGRKEHPSKHLTTEIHEQVHPPERKQTKKVSKSAKRGIR